MADKQPTLLQRMVVLEQNMAEVQAYADRIMDMNLLLHHAEAMQNVMSNNRKAHSILTLQELHATGFNDVEISKKIGSIIHRAQVFEGAMGLVNSVKGANDG